MTFYIKDKEIVIPGQLLAENEKFGENCFLENFKIYSYVHGMARIKEKVEVISLNGIYVPKVGDVVIGIVKESYLSTFYVDLNSPYKGIILKTENSRRNFNIENKEEIYKRGDIISGIVIKVDEVKRAILSKIFTISPEYILVYVNPKRVPRVIGKRKSMLEILKENTGCRIIVGQNGIIAVSGKNSEKAKKIIKYIEENAYIDGLTNRVVEMLKKG